MSRLPMSLRIALGVASLSVSALCVLYSLGLMPDATGAALNGRKALCEAIAIHSSMAALRGDYAAIEASTRAIVERNPEIASAEVRLADGRLLAAFQGPGGPSAGAGATRVDVPIHMNDHRWGTVQVVFRSSSWLRGLPFTPPLDREMRFILVFAVVTLLAQYLYLSFILNHAQRPDNRAIPERVRATLDTLVEGVLLMDNENRIALANEAFARTVGRSVEELESQTAESLGWARPDRTERPADLPWERAARGGAQDLGSVIALETSSNGFRTFSVNTTPIVSDSGTRVGVLATFDDLTTVERKNLQLRKMLDKLKDSRAEIRRQNQQLKDLATIDPLTGCLNRRAFYERFEAAWKGAERHGHALSVVILDIDHFKSVNDRYGHAVGDQALQVVSAVLKGMIRGSDVLCRYGGEEFCVLLPNTPIDEAVAAAERFRKGIASRTFANISVTSSFGVASIEMGATDPHDLLNRSDKALYAAKRGGRNRVVRFDQIPEELQNADPKEARPRDAAPPMEVANPIPYHAVTSLLAALAHRDPATAEHSRRVADLCVATARGVLSGRDCYVLEIAGLLHDVGKLGIPDAILKKPGPLNEEEWRVMRAHDRMGVEIITAAFSSLELREIVEAHHARYDGQHDPEEGVSGEAIPVGARILTIADAYDAMVSDRVYRKGRKPEEAFQELRRHAGTQFDPNLVERFIEAVVQRGREAGPVRAVRPLSKDGALRVGLLIEKLAEALDAKNLESLRGTLARILHVAKQLEIAPVEEAAAKLDQLVNEKGEWVEILILANELLDQCRATQACYLATYRVDDESTPDGNPRPGALGHGSGVEPEAESEAEAEAADAFAAA